MLVLAPFSLAFWDVGEEALPYAALSAVLEIAYLLGLAKAYEKLDLSAVYPVARGSAPVIVLLVSVAFLGAGVPLLAAVGVVVVAAGIALVHGGAARSVAAIGAGLLIGLTIAGYTLSDAEGLRHAAAVPYLLLTLGPAAIVLPLFVGRERVRAAVSPGVVTAGMGMVGGYVLVLWALEVGTRADVPAVAAVRETSVVIAVALAAVFLGEDVGRRRALGAAVVVAGVALLGA